MIAEQLHTTVHKVRQRRKELGVFLGCTAILSDLPIPDLLRLQAAVHRELER